MSCLKNITLSVFLGLTAICFAKPEAGNTEANKQLLNASLRGDTKKVKELLKAGVDVDTRDAFENTSLMLAALNGQVEVMRQLLDAGANVNAVDVGGMPALLHSFANGHAGGFELLRKAGANIHATDDRGTNALILAAKSGHSVGIGQLLQMLIDAGLDVNAQDKGGYTALMYVTDIDQLSDPIRILIEAGADVNKGPAGLTPLILAVQEDLEPAVLKLLLESGVQQKEIKQILQDIKLDDEVRALLKQYVKTSDTPTDIHEEL